MANIRTASSANTFREYATVDTAPGASGYYTNSVNPRQLHKNTGASEIYFSIKGTGSMSVTLQFKLASDAAWNDYADYDANGVYKIPALRIPLTWRAGVKNNSNYTSGSKTFGFDW